SRPQLARRRRAGGWAGKKRPTGTSEPEPRSQIRNAALWAAFLPFPRCRKLRARLTPRLFLHPRCALPAYLLFPAPVAHGYVGVVAAEEDLLAFGHDAAVGGHASVYRGLGAAGADRLYLRYRIRQLHEAHGAGKHVRQ